MSICFYFIFSELMESKNDERKETDGEMARGAMAFLLHFGIRNPPVFSYLVNVARLFRPRPNDETVEIWEIRLSLEEALRIGKAKQTWLLENPIEPLSLCLDHSTASAPRSLLPELRFDISSNTRSITERPFSEPQLEKLALEAKVGDETVIVIRLVSSGASLVGMPQWMRFVVSHSQIFAPANRLAFLDDMASLYCTTYKAIVESLRKNLRLGKDSESRLESYKILGDMLQFVYACVHSSPLAPPMSLARVNDNSSSNDTIIELGKMKLAVRSDRPQMPCTVCSERPEEGQTMLCCPECRLFSYCSLTCMAAHYHGAPLQAPPEQLQQQQPSDAVSAAAAAAETAAGTPSPSVAAAPAPEPAETSTRELLPHSMLCSFCAICSIMWMQLPDDALDSDWRLLITRARQKQ